jgi:type I restriction enzyme M protein
MDSKNGRCAILFPHGVLFRKEEAEMRRKLVEADLVECVLGLGPNLFYNSPMEACIVICRSQKSPERQGRVLFIDAVNEIARERAMSFLRPTHQTRIVNAYQAFTNEAGFAQVATLNEIARQEFSLSIPLYVKRSSTGSNGTQPEQATLTELWSAWEQEGREFWQEMDVLVDMLDKIIESD